MSDWRPGMDRAALQARARLLSQLREFFTRRGVLEVDTPLLASHGVTDPAIEPLRVFSAPTSSAPPLFLQSSPEFFMKRLLAAGSGDIYQLGPVFRRGEQGSRHNPEFTMLEWYRLGFSLADLIDEVGQLVGPCLGRSSWESATYQELFLDVLDLDPHTAATEALEHAARARLDLGELALDRDGWLDLLMSHCIEPKIAGRGLLFVTAYPASQAALACCTEVDGQAVADRFELYVDGVELANGYRELQDPRELERRADLDNARRRAAGQEERVLDPRLLAALHHGLPSCSGVALGVDRLLMKQLGAERLDDVMPFSAPRC